MTDKKTKKNQNSAVMSREDIQLYRLFMIFGAAILGFAGLRLIPERTFSIVLKAGQWVALALLVVAIAGLVYIRLIKKADESRRLVTSVGVAYFLIPVLFMLASYRTLERANFKCQIFFAIISVFAVIYNVFKRDFKNISALMFVCAIGLYYATTNTYNWLENILAAVSKVLVFVFPLAVIVLLVCAFCSKNGTVTIGGRAIYVLPSKFSGIMALIISALLLVAAALLIVVPAAFTYVMLSLLIVYVAVGVVCTIRLI